MFETLITESLRRLLEIQFVTLIDKIPKKIEIGIFLFMELG